MSIAQILAFLEQIVGELTGSQSITAAITLLSQIISLVGEEITTVAPMIKNIIAALQNNGAITQQQLSDLAALDQQTDAAFEAAATTAGATPAN